MEWEDRIMKSDARDNERLLDQVCEALGRGGEPSGAVYAAIHAAAMQHAARRRNPWVRGWLLWRRAVLGSGGVVAALLVLWFAVSQPPSVTESTIHSADFSEAALALMMLAADEDPFVVEAPSTDLLADYLLRFQEIPGEFEIAHTIYSSYH